MTKFAFDKIWSEQLEQREQQVTCSSAHASQLLPTEQPLPVQDEKTPGKFTLKYQHKNSV